MSNRTVLFFLYLPQESFPNSTVPYLSSIFVEGHLVKSCPPFRLYLPRGSLANCTVFFFQFCGSGSASVGRIRMFLGLPDPVSHKYGFGSGSGPGSGSGSLHHQSKIVRKTKTSTVLCSVADPDPGSDAFLTPGSGIRNRFFPFMYPLKPHLLL
jgi:hypothetical protein